MNAIQFTTVVGPDGVIRPPTGTILPQGAIEVLVRPAASDIDAEIAATMPTLEEIDAMTPEQCKAWRDDKSWIDDNKE
jgi:hypothetical protein